MTEISTTGAVIIHGEHFVPYISETEIQQRVREIAHQLEDRYSGSRPVAICILNGAFMFFADLLRNMSLDVEIDFVKISSYGQDMSTSRDVRLVLPPTADLRGRDVILVEDIVDSGYSIDFLTRYLESLRIESLSVVSLLHKPEATMVSNSLDYVGFTIPAKFVIGYGLDYDQHARYLPSIYILDDGVEGTDR
jgi:hypoxanthine phosphoribosyltransferase